MTTPSPAVVVVGSLNTDHLVRVDRLPDEGETVMAGDYLVAAGGKGLNQAVAAARQGVSVALVVNPIRLEAVEAHGATTEPYVRLRTVSDEVQFGRLDAEQFRDGIDLVAGRHAADNCPRPTPVLFQMIQRQRQDLVGHRTPRRHRG